VSEDDIDSLIVEATEWVEDNGTYHGHPFFDDDHIYEKWSNLFYKHLERFCTRERNYN
jgi:hypothetical protein